MSKQKKNLHEFISPTHLIKLILIFLILVLGYLFVSNFWKSVDIIQVNISNNNLSLSKLDQVILKNIQRIVKSEDLKNIFSKEYQPYILPDLYVNQCEVTNQEYKGFLGWYKDQGNDYQSLLHASSNKVFLGKNQSPVTGVDYQGAYEYCKATGGRLAKSEEFLALAKYNETLYSWGDKVDFQVAPFSEPSLNVSQICIKNKNDVNLQGIKQLSTGVSEWTDFTGYEMFISSKKEDDNLDELSIIMGGNSVKMPFSLLLLNDIYRFRKKDWRSPLIGFRCVYEKKPNLTPWKIKINTQQIKSKLVNIGMPKEARLSKIFKNTKDSKQIIEIAKALSKQQTQQKLKTDKSKIIYFSKYEISRKQYQLFLYDPFVQLKVYADENEPKGNDYTPRNWLEQLKEPNKPVVEVNWWAAYAYANWLGGRLPTEQEWIEAYNTEQLYTWGNDYRINKTSDLQYKDEYETLDVEYFLDDESKNKVTFLAGNVSEWTNDITIINNQVQAIVKGGSYAIPGDKYSTYSYSRTLPLEIKTNDVGLRVVFDKI